MVGIARLGVWLQLLPLDMVSRARSPDPERGPGAPLASLCLARARPARDRPFRRLGCHPLGFVVPAALPPRPPPGGCGHRESSSALGPGHPTDGLLSVVAGAAPLFLSAS